MKGLILPKSPGFFIAEVFKLEGTHFLLWPQVVPCVTISHGTFP